MSAFAKLMTPMLFRKLSLNPGQDYLQVMDHSCPQSDPVKPIAYLIRAKQALLSRHAPDGPIPLEDHPLLNELDRLIAGKGSARTSLDFDGGAPRLTVFQGLQPGLAAVMRSPFCLAVAGWNPAVG